MARRKRSDMTHAEAVKEVSRWASSIERMLTSSESFLVGDTEDCPPGSIVHKFQVKGGFESNHEIFEALRVLGGHKLPANTATREQS